jgi:hypothetical protein
VSERPIPGTKTNYLDAASGQVASLQGSNGGYGSSFQPVSRQVASPYTIDQTESSITIQSAISQALAEAREDHMKMISLQQDAHRKEIETLTVSFQQAQMKSFEKNLNQNNQQPERINFLEDKMERTSNQLDARLDKIIDLLLLNQGNTTGPSPFRKKTRHEISKEANMEIDHFDKLTAEVQDNRESQTNGSQMTSPTQIGSPAQATTSTGTPILHKHSSEDDTMQDTNKGNPPPLPDSPNQDDNTWLKRKTSASVVFKEKAKTLLNPYRTAQETLKMNKKNTHIGLLNAPNTPMSVHLTTLSSSLSDTASRGRES